MKTLDSFRNKHSQIWLNIGAGSYAIPDFVNIDNSTFLQLLPLFPLLKPFIGKRRCSRFEEYGRAVKVAPYFAHDCGKPLPFPAESVDHILTSHFLEHLYHADAERIVRSFFRILKPGASIHVIVPDLTAYVRHYVENTGKPDAASQFIESLILSKKSCPSLLLRWREFVGGFGLLHRWMYDGASMRELLEGVGFQIVTDTDSPSRHWRENENDRQVNLLAIKPAS